MNPLIAYTNRLEHIVRTPPMSESKSEFLARERTTDSDNLD